MKTQAFLLLIAGILAVHTVVLFLVVRSGSLSPAATAQVSPSADGSQKPSVALDPNSREMPSLSGPAPMEASTKDGKLLCLPKSANFGAPLNDRYAVKGTIPGLPSSANATVGILVDLNTRNVLWSKNPDTAKPIASMTKIMTILLAYEEILSGRDGLSLDTPVKVSRKAALVEESQVYLDERETFPMRDLLLASSVKSANDAAYLVAEYLGGGDVQRFVDMMNEKAQRIGMNHTKFFNPHGLPGKKSIYDNVSSPADMAILAEHTMRYPQLMEWAGTLNADFRTPGKKGYIAMRNHNNLLKGARTECPGVTGLKTGFISRAGFCITITADRDGRKMVAVAMGFPQSRDRDQFVRSLIEWGYQRADHPSAPLPVQKAASPNGTRKAAKKKTSSTR